MPCDVTNDKKKIKVKEEKFQPLSSKYKKISEKEEAKRARAEMKKLKQMKTKDKIKTGGKNAAGEMEEESQFNLNKQSNIIILSRLYKGRLKKQAPTVHGSSSYLLQALLSSSGVRVLSKLLFNSCEV